MHILTIGDVLIKNLVDFYFTHNSNKWVFWVPKPQQMGSNNSEREEEWGCMTIIKSNRGQHNCRGEDQKN